MVPSGGNLQAALQRSQDHVGIDADVLRLRQDARYLGAILRLLDEFGGAEGGPDQRGDDFRILLGPALPDAEHLLGGAHQNVRDEMQDVADAAIDRDRVPGRADAECVDLAAGDAVHHVGRRQHHETNILVGIDARPAAIQNRSW